jgi:hypothetical protein
MRYNRCYMPEDIFVVQLLNTFRICSSARADSTQYRDSLEMYMIPFYKWVMHPVA